jgi:hypothetical protein
VDAEELRRKKREYDARQPTQRCGVEGCEFQTKKTSNLKKHQARVHGIGVAKAAEELRRKKKERLNKYKARQPAQRRGVDGGESESEESESAESGKPDEVEPAAGEPAVEADPDMPAVGSTVVVKWGTEYLPSEVVEANAWEVPDYEHKNTSRAVRGFVVSWRGVGEESESFVPMTWKWRVRREDE